MNAATKEFFREQGRIGGKKMAENLTPKKRKAIGKMLAEARARAKKRRDV